MQLLNKLGIDAGYMIIGLCFVIVVLIILMIVMWNKFKQFRANYSTFMQGKDGAYRRLHGCRHLCFRNIKNFQYLW